MRPHAATVEYRRVLPRDYEALVQRHREIFPIEYEQGFYNNAIYGEDNRFCFAAVVSVAAFEAASDKAKPPQNDPNGDPRSSDYTPSHAQALMSGAATLGGPGVGNSESVQPHGNTSGTPVSNNTVYQHRLPCSADGELLGIASPKADGEQYLVGNGEALIGFITARVYTERDEQWKGVVDDTLLPPLPRLGRRNETLALQLIRFLTDSAFWCTPRWGTGDLGDTAPSRNRANGTAETAHQESNDDTSLAVSVHLGDDPAIANRQQQHQSPTLPASRLASNTGVDASEGIRPPAAALAWSTVYISTLGVAREFRKLGVAKELVRRVCAAADERRYCLAVYLHVIRSNLQAINFYESLHFRCVRELREFYWIHQQPHGAFVYLRETAKATEQLEQRSLLSGVRALVSRVYNQLASWLLRVVAGISLLRVRSERGNSKLLTYSAPLEAPGDEL
mmetsp:Transcript_9805/g.35934  ORF Transcript_9805/g.35934 Transcript_9805/m.35934 type:complete len:451 (+) Transcript_9805:169-1521(+)